MAINPDDLTAAVTAQLMLGAQPYEILAALVRATARCSIGLADGTIDAENADSAGLARAYAEQANTLSGMVSRFGQLYPPIVEAGRPRVSTGRPGKSQGRH